MRERFETLALRWWIAVDQPAEDGQSTVEYAVVTSAVVVAALAVVVLLESGMKGAFESLVSKLPK